MGDSEKTQSFVRTYIKAASVKAAEFGYGTYELLNAMFLLAVKRKGAALLYKAKGHGRWGWPDAGALSVGATMTVESGTERSP